MNYQEINDKYNELYKNGVKKIGKLVTCFFIVAVAASVILHQHYYTILSTMCSIIAVCGTIIGIAMIDYVHGDNCKKMAKIMVSTHIIGCAVLETFTVISCDVLLNVHISPAMTCISAALVIFIIYAVAIGYTLISCAIYSGTLPNMKIICK